DGLAVGGGARRHLRRDDRARAWTIVDDDGPLELVLQLLRQHAGENVGAAAGGKRAEKCHRVLWIIVGRCLRARGLHRGEAACESETQHASSFHASLCDHALGKRGVAVLPTPASTADASAPGAEKASAFVAQSEPR